MSISDPIGQPDGERPIDITDTPGDDGPGPLPTPEPQPDHESRPGEAPSLPEPGQPAQQ
ncbi:hypothetical protein Dvina_20590 [Dactylosporangium vinaceum]|uniref:Uncharacterized protein n=1 Tax=Dactylosporangium vinaceum TaxID=53362 RepID=A0ABV5MS42_9ACTN|nr:hypothetical protein [Dactylosporangium vinaceum]UAC00246.1 hypothetical protein Dvina_20590 [Dactylosporangium vinaceum]